MPTLISWTNEVWNPITGCSRISEGCRHCYAERLSLWRKLRKLGVVQLGDGLVALPHDARTQEHFEWQAAAVVEAGGEAMVWVATPAARRDTAALVERMRAARDDEYRALIAEVRDAAPNAVDGRTRARLRRTLREINRRDYFRAPARDDARRAIADLVDHSVDHSRADAS